MGLRNDIRREIDEAEKLMTGEDAIEFLLARVGWDVSRKFSTLHNGLMMGSCEDCTLPYTTGPVTGSPLYEREKLLIWARLN